MQQFALASVYPRSIAWLIRLNEWDRFNKVVQYNCAMVGGYFNVIIPLTDQDTLSDEYQSFLVDYDPDLIVLAPGMISSQIDSLSACLHVFGIIPWEAVSQIATLDPWAGATSISATVGPRLTDKKSGIAIVAAADDAWPDTSRLAMVACGDVQPRQPLLDDDMSLDATGHREVFLADLLKPEYHRNDVEAQLVQSSSGEGLEFVPAPNRYQLAKLILDKHKFPLFGSAEILKICCRVQDHPLTYQTFIGLTAYYKQGGTPERAYDWESNPDEVLRWLDYNYGGVFYASKSHGFDIAFSSSIAAFAQLHDSFDHLQSKRQQKIPTWNILLHDDLAFYNYVKPHIRQERVLVTKDGSRCTFIPKLPQESYSGAYTITLKWDDCMLPQNSTLVRNSISSESLEGFMPLWKDGHKVVEKGIMMPRFRITKERYLKSQVSSDEPIVFERPSPEQVVGTLFTSAGFSRIELSSAARYHKNFVDRAGGLEDAAYYLATSPYRELFEALSDNSNKHKPGWILSSPSKRRALHHLHLRKVLGQATPAETQEYFDTVSDELPEEVANLLERGIFERGFLLKCASCSFSSWYPAEHVGQQFECSRCFQSQVYQSNPLWLYKLREVIFQGFEDNMQVPLLALHQVRSTSRHHFKWVPDSDVYWTEEGKELHRNIDVLCLCDGKLYIGEAKSNDEIEADQFSFYADVCRRVAIDGIVFATSKSHWGRGTLERIKQLKTWFKGEVIVLTEDELYQKTLS